MKGQLAGHGLQHEGRVPHTWDYGSGEGVAECACGAQSESLPTTAARKRWHEQHKDAIRAQLTAPASHAPSS